MYSLAVLQGGRLASGSRDQMIKIWNLATGACVATLEGHEGAVVALAVLEDGRLASGSDDATIKVWDIAAGACMATLEGHEDWVCSLAVLEGGRLASVSYHDLMPYHYTIKIWDSALSNILR